MEFYCECGNKLKSENIEHQNKCNELGEDYCEFDITCDKCSKMYNSSCWGTVEEGGVDKLEMSEDIIFENQLDKCGDFKTLQYFKNKSAVEHGYFSWSQFIREIKKSPLGANFSSQIIHYATDEVKKTYQEYLNSVK